MIGFMGSKKKEGGGNICRILRFIKTGPSLSINYSTVCSGNNKQKL